MRDWKLPWTGGCRCGRVRFVVTAPPLATMACHCTGCQRMTASAFSLSVAVPAEGFTVTQGEPVLGGLQGASKHLHCPFCKSWMFSRPDGLDWMVNIRATMLDEHGWFVPFAETWTSEALPWAKTPAKYSFPTQPELDAYQPIVEEFAREGAGPS